MADMMKERSKCTRSVCGGANGSRTQDAAPPWLPTPVTQSSSASARERSPKPKPKGRSAAGCHLQAHQDPI